MPLSSLINVLILLAILVAIPPTIGVLQVFLFSLFRWLSGRPEGDEARGAKRGALMTVLSFCLWFLAISVMIETNLALEIGRLPLAIVVLGLFTFRAACRIRLLRALNRDLRMTHSSRGTSLRLNLYLSMLRHLEWPIIWTFIAIRVAYYDTATGWIIWWPGIFLLTFLLPASTLIPDRLANLITRVEAPPPARLARAIATFIPTIRSASLIRTGDGQVTEFNIYHWRNHLTVSESLLNTLDDEELHCLLLQVQYTLKRPLGHVLFDTVLETIKPLAVMAAFVLWPWILDPNGPLRLATGWGHSTTSAVAWGVGGVAAAWCARRYLSQLLQLWREADAFVLRQGGSPEVLALALLKIQLHADDGAIDPVTALETRAIPKMLEERIEALGVFDHSSDPFDSPSESDSEDSTRRIGRAE